MMTIKRLTTLVMLLVAMAMGAKADTYKLWVGETQVTDANKGDILGDGTMTYDPATNTMTLDGTSITSHGNEDYAICNYAESGPVPGNIEVNKLIIEVKSDSQLSTDDQCLYFRAADVTITGPGKLTMKSKYNDAICILVGSLTISEADILANGRDGVICGTGSALTIDNSTLNACPQYSNRRPVIYDFNEVQLKECYYADAAYDYCLWYGSNINYDDNILELSYSGDYFSEESGDDIHWEGMYSSWLTILPAKKTFDIEVGGVQVTTDNADDLVKAINDQGESGLTASGTIRYDIANNVLTLENATIEGPLANKAILSNGLCMYLFGSFLVLGGVPGLRIEVYGDCVLQNTSGMSAGMALSLATTIDVHSGATLTVKAYNYGLIVGDQVDIVEGNLSFEGGNPGRGIDGYTGSTLNLFEGKGTLCVKSGFSGISNLNLMNGTQIVSPEGAYYDAEERNIYDSNGYLAHDVVLSNATTPTRIDKPSTPVTHHPSAVYDLQGRLAPSYPRTPAPSKRKDIYIINGKKYINY